MELLSPCLVLCLILAVNSAPVQYITLPASTYQLRPQRQQPIFYITPNALSKTADNPAESETSLKYLAVTHPEASANQRYVIAPYMSPHGFFPFAHSQVTGLGPQGYLNNNQYAVYPAGTELLRTAQRPSVWETFTGFIGQLPIFNRPTNNQESQKPPTDTVLPPLSEGVSGEKPSEETDELDVVNPDGAVPPIPSVENVENPIAETPMNPMSGGAAEEPMSQTSGAADTAQVASESRMITRSRAMVGREGEGD